MLSKDIAFKLSPNSFSVISIPVLCVRHRRILSPNKCPSLWCHVHTTSSNSTIFAFICLVRKNPIRPFACLLSVHDVSPAWLDAVTIYFLQAAMTAFIFVFKQYILLTSGVGSSKPDSSNLWAQRKGRKNRTMLIFRSERPNERTNITVRWKSFGDDSRAECAYPVRREQKLVGGT